MHIQAFDATAGLALPECARTGATLNDAAGGVNMTEISTGVYGNAYPVFRFNFFCRKVWLLTSAVAPVTAADWESSVKSNALNVDNTNPLVNTPGQYDATANSVAVQFSEGMNATVLTTKGTSCMQKYNEGWYYRRVEHSSCQR